MLRASPRHGSSGRQPALAQQALTSCTRGARRPRPRARPAAAAPPGRGPGGRAWLTVNETTAMGAARGGRERRAVAQGGGRAGPGVGGAVPTHSSSANRPATRSAHVKRLGAARRALEQAGARRQQSRKQGHCALHCAGLTWVRGRVCRCLRELWEDCGQERAGENLNWQASHMGRTARPPIASCPSLVVAAG